VKDQYGCEGVSAPISITLKTPVKPVVSYEGKLEFCQGKSLTLEAPNGTNYKWSNGSTSTSVDVTKAGIYFVEVTDEDGCKNTSDNVDVKMNVLPIVRIMPGIVGMCANTSFEAYPIITNTSPPNFKYLWSTGATTERILISKSGDYFISVTDGNGCVGKSDVVNIRVSPLPINEVSISGKTTFCDGNDVTLTGIKSSSYTYQWYNRNVALPNEKSNILKVNKSGTYILKLNQYGCEVLSDSVVVDVKPKPTLNFMLPDSVNTAQKNIPLKATPSGGVFKGDGIIGTNLFLDKLPEGLYMASYSYTDSYGCSSTKYSSTTIYKQKNQSPNSSYTSISSCGSYVWNGKTYSQSGEYTDTLKTSKGTDSIATLDLTINPPSKDLSVVNGVLTANQGNALYQWLNCGMNNVPILNEKSQTFKPTSKGEYAVIINLNGCIDTTACAKFELAEIDVLNKVSFVTFPNPSTGTFTISGAPMGQYAILNELGVTVYHFVVKSDVDQSIQVEGLAKGVYFLRGTKDNFVQEKIVVM
jgi:hypothetical protein